MENNTHHAPFKRTRSGCLICRQRKRKCDGRQPICGGCEVRHQSCRWGLKVSFHASRSLRLSQGDSDALQSIERQRNSLNHVQPPDRSSQSQARPLRLRIINDTEKVVRSYRPLETDSSSDESYVTPILESPVPPEPPKLSGLIDSLTDDTSTTEHPYILPHTATAGIFSEIDSHPRPALQGNIPSALDALPIDLLLADFDPSELRDHPPGQSPDVPFFLGHAISRYSSPLPDPSFPVSQSMRTELLAAYLQETASWCETTDSNASFSVGSAHSMMESPPFVAAAMALASRQQDAVRRRHSPVTLELYQYAIRLLLRRDPIQADASILATCVALCVYEMMASSVSEWRRHLRGCAGFLKTHQWNGSSSGIVKTCFWAFTRIDVWTAFVLNQPTLIPTDYWVSDDSLDLALSKDNIDDYCNLAILLFARVVNLLNPDSGRPSAVLGLSLQESLRKAWQGLQEWRTRRPDRVRAILSDESSREVRGCFPTIVYTHSSANCGNTFYHAGCILLLQSGYLDLYSGSLRADQQASDQLWHARALLGTSISNPSHANWVNQLQPLYIAGQVFGQASQEATTESHSRAKSSTMHQRRVPLTVRQRHNYGSTTGSIGDDQHDDEGGRYDYAAEKMALLKHLATIQRITGWKTSDRARDLRILWGLEV